MATTSRLEPPEHGERGWAASRTGLPAMGDRGDPPVRVGHRPWHELRVPRAAAAPSREDRPRRAATGTVASLRWALAFYGALGFIPIGKAVVIWLGS